MSAAVEHVLYDKRGEVAYITAGADLKTHAPEWDKTDRGRAGATTNTL